QQQQSLGGADQPLAPAGDGELGGGRPIRAFAGGGDAADVGLLLVGQDHRFEAALRGGRVVADEGALADTGQALHADGDVRRDGAAEHGFLCTGHALQVGAPGAWQDARHDRQAGAVSIPARDSSGGTIRFTGSLGGTPPSQEEGSLRVKRGAPPNGASTRYTSRP